jgi:nucleoid-associated protein YgaU
VVQPGESFWSIAVTIADARAGGPAPTKAVDVIWRALIEANRAQLPKPRNPSLLYVGTTLTVPP